MPLRTVRDLEADRESEKASPGLVANIENETNFRLKAFELVLLSYKDARYVMDAKTLMDIAREYSGSGQDAGYSYRRRLFAKKAAKSGAYNPGEIRPLVEEFDESVGEKYCTFRLPEDRKLTVEQLVMKYPKVGQVNTREAVAGG